VANKYSSPGPPASHPVFVSMKWTRPAIPGPLGVGSRGVRLQVLPPSVVASKAPSRKFALLLIARSIHPCTGSTKSIHASPESCVGSRFGGSLRRVTDQSAPELVVEAKSKTARSSLSALRRSTQPVEMSKKNTDDMLSLAGVSGVMSVQCAPPS